MMNDLQKLQAAGVVGTVGDLLNELPGGSPPPAADAAPGTNAPPVPGDLILFFDTETTGLPVWSSPSDAVDQPHIVSLAAELCTPDGTVIESYNEIVRIGVPIPEETITIHGITDAIANERGLPPKQMLAEFFGLIDRASLVVGYNTGFDIRMVRIASARHFSEKWECPKPKDDAMWIVVKQMGVKKPKLTAAYEMVFGRPFDGAHNAMQDCTATREIYFEMVRRGYVSDNPRVVAGGNMPPADVPVVVEAAPAAEQRTPLEAHTSNINDLYEEAHNWLDGSPIENQAQANEVTRLLDMAKKAGKAAEAQRVIEKKPHDNAAAAVQKVWKPLVDKAARIETGTKGAIGKWLLKVQAEQRAKADADAAAAKIIADKARAEHEAAAQSGNLTAIEDAEQGLKDAKIATTEATRSDNARPVAKVEGMGRGVGLTTVWDVVLSGDDGDAQALAKHYWQTKRADVIEFYMSLARGDVRAGTRSLPGTTISSRQVAR